jgi:hypothetical protein
MLLAKAETPAPVEISTKAGTPTTAVTSVTEGKQQL